jgi:ABC-type polysaccharide/polyol phosphate export permease
VVLVIPAVTLLVALTAGLALVTSALHVYFRDLRYVVSALLSAWFYGTPVIYPLGLAPDSIEPFIRANPVTGVVELFRAATVGADDGWLLSVAVAVAWALVLWSIALALHARFNRVFVDLL